MIIVASGDNRVCEEKVARLVGENLGRASADFVRKQTGYVIGGVSPIGHATPIRLFLDADLKRFARLWAPAGTPHAVFPLSPDELAALTGSPWADVRLDDR